MQDDSAVAGGPVGRREWKWVSVQGGADPLWGSFPLSKPPTGPSFIAQWDWLSGLASTHRGAGDPGMILPALPLLGKTCAWCHQCQGDLPGSFQHARLSRNKGTAQRPLGSIRGTDTAGSFYLNIHKKGWTYLQDSCENSATGSAPIRARNMASLIKNLCNGWRNQSYSSFSHFKWEKEVQRDLAICSGSHSRSARI